jgi:hypothetical protein
MLATALYVVRFSPGLPHDLAHPGTQGNPGATWAASIVTFCTKERSIDAGLNKCRCAAQCSALTSCATLYLEALQGYASVNMQCV